MTRVELDALSRSGLDAVAAQEVEQPPPSPAEAQVVVLGLHQAVPGLIRLDDPLRAPAVDEDEQSYIAVHFEPVRLEAAEYQDRREGKIISLNLGGH